MNVGCYNWLFWKADGHWSPLSFCHTFDSSYAASFSDCYTLTKLPIGFSYSSPDPSESGFDSDTRDSGTAFFCIYCNSSIFYSYDSIMLLISKAALSTFYSNATGFSFIDSRWMHIWFGISFSKSLKSIGSNSSNYTMSLTAWFSFSSIIKPSGLSSSSIISVKSAVPTPIIIIEQAFLESYTMSSFVSSMSFIAPSASSKRTEYFFNFCFSYCSTYSWNFFRIGTNWVGPARLTSSTDCLYVLMTSYIEPLMQAFYWLLIGNECSTASLPFGIPPKP